MAPTANLRSICDLLGLHHGSKREMLRLSRGDDWGEPKMRKRISAYLVTSSLLISGCSHVARDLRHPGGVVGGVLDKRMFDASRSKDLVLLRSAILIAMVARAGTVYSRDRKDSDAYVNYIISAADEINISAGHIRSADGTTSTGLACGLPVQASERTQVAAPVDNLNPASIVAPPDTPNSDGCFTYAVNFESDVPILERRLFKLAMAALPQEQAKRFLDQITQGDALGAAMAAFSFSAKALDGLHSGAAVHRTGIEVVARQHDNCKKKDDLATVFDAATCMGLATDNLFVGKHDERGSYNPTANSSLFHALMRNIRDSCRMIPLGIDEAVADLNEARNKRIADCDGIQFRPRSRWDTAR